MEKGFIRTYCPECGAMNRIEVEFPDYNKGFIDKEFDCCSCNTHLTVTDNHIYSKDGKILN